MTARRAHRVKVPGAIEAAGALAESDYASAFELRAPDAEASTPEQWARAVWEGAPGLVRWFLRTGWTLVLGLRLGPRSSPSHVLGWHIAAAQGDSITLQASSRLMAAHNVVVVGDASVVWVTTVRFNRRIARPVWAMTAPIHHATIPRLLKRAATTSA